MTALQSRNDTKARLGPGHVKYLDGRSKQVEDGRPHVTAAMNVT